MKILIDADGCPVVDITVKLGQKYNIETIIIFLFIGSYYFIINMFIFFYKSFHLKYFLKIHQ